MIILIFNADFLNLSMDAGKLHQYILNSFSEINGCKYEDIIFQSKS